MCNYYNKSRKIVLDFIEQKDGFTLSELQAEIRRQGGAMRVAPSITIKEYLSEFEEAGILGYVPKDGRYLVTVKK